MNAQAYFGINASCQLTLAVRDGQISDSTIRDAFAVLLEVYNRYGLESELAHVFTNKDSVALVWSMGWNDARITISPDGIRYVAYSKANEYPIEGFSCAEALFEGLKQL